MVTVRPLRKNPRWTDSEIKDNFARQVINNKKYLYVISIILMQMVQKRRARNEVRSINEKSFFFRRS